MSKKNRLETMDYSVQIESKEGIPPHYLAQEQLLYLSTQDRALVTQTQFADAKAGALMTLMGLLVLRGPIGDADGEFGVAVEFIALVATGLCLVACLWAVIPRYPNPAARRAIALQDVYSWPGLVSDRFDREDYVKFLRTSQHSQLVASLARSNSAHSQILLRKFRLIRFAFLCGCVALVMIFIRNLAGL